MEREEVVMGRGYGTYYRRELIEKEAPEVIAEWDEWLEANSDPGHYDHHKERDQSVLPYIDGHPQWVCDIYMPPHIADKLPPHLRRKRLIS